MTNDLLNDEQMYELLVILMLQKKDRNRAQVVLLFFLPLCLLFLVLELKRVFGGFFCRAYGGEIQNL